jgi:hypothetical protein
MQRREQVFVMRKFTVRESSLDRVALLVSCSTGLLLYWSPALLVSCSTGLLLYWSPALLVSCSTGLLLYTLLLYTLLLYCGAESKKPV